MSHQQDKVNQRWDINYCWLVEEAVGPLELGLDGRLKERVVRVELAQGKLAA